MPNPVCFPENKDWEERDLRSRMLSEQSWAQTVWWGVPGLESKSQSWQAGCLRVSVAMMKHHDQRANWGGKSLIGLYFSIVHYWRKSAQELNTGQDPRSRSWYRGHGGELLTGLLPLTGSVCHPIEQGIKSLGMAPPTMDWTLLHWSLRKHLTAGSRGGISSSEAPFSNDSSLCQVDT